MVRPRDRPDASTKPAATHWSVSRLAARKWEEEHPSWLTAHMCFLQTAALVHVDM